MVEWVVDLEIHYHQVVVGGEAQSQQAPGAQCQGNPPAHSLWALIPQSADPLLPHQEVPLGDPFLFLKIGTLLNQSIICVTGSKDSFLLVKLLASLSEGVTGCLIHFKVNKHHADQATGV